MELPTTKMVKRIDVATFVSLLMGSRHKFLTLVWQSNKSKELYQTERVCSECGHVFFGRATKCPVEGCQGKGKQQPTPFKGKAVTRVYVAAMRNDFNFENAVRNMLERQGEDASEWEGPKERTWGKHIDNTPFVVHTPKDDELMRLYGHFLPGTRKNGKRSYFEVKGFTGYYVNGRKADDKEVEKYKRPRKEAETAVDKARLEQHPVNARLDDGAFVKIAGQWYLILPPSDEEIESVSKAVLEFSQVVAEAA